MSVQPKWKDGREIPLLPTTALQKLKKKLKARVMTGVSEAEASGVDVPLNVTLTVSCVAAVDVIR